MMCVVLSTAIMFRYHDMMGEGIADHMLFCCCAIEYLGLTGVARNEASKGRSMSSSMH